MMFEKNGKFNDFGHIVIRVANGGGEFYVYMLDDTDFEYKVKSIHGPYTSKYTNSSANCTAICLLAFGHWPLAIGLIEVSAEPTYINPRSGYH